MTRSLKERVFNSGMWVVGNYGIQQLLRFGSNLILTRLLFPEAFGLMAIVQTVVLGINLLSDLGINTSIIQHKRGEDEDFLNTAWTLQIARGVLLFLVALLVSDFFADFYHQPMLAQLLPVVAFGMLIQSFRSTKMIVANRTLNMKRNVLIDLFSYSIGVVVTVLVAWYFRSVWALVVGNLFNAVIAVWASHQMLPGQHNRIAWHHASFQEIFGLGKWFFLSSVLTFFSGEGNRLIVGKLLDIRSLGFYTLATMLAGVFGQLISLIVSKILLPAYSEVVRQHPERLHSVLTRTRIYIVVPGYLVAIFLAIYGQEVIDFIYDDRYSSAGKMLMLVSIGMFPNIINGSYQGVLTAKGKVKANTILQAITIALQITLMYFGHHYYGELGVVASFAAANWLLAIPFAITYYHAGCWQPRMDIPFLVGALVFVLYRASILLG